jgi:hypothetical protein
VKDTAQLSEIKHQQLTENAALCFKAVALEMLHLFEEKQNPCFKILTLFHNSLTRTLTHNTNPNSNQ